MLASTETPGKEWKSFVSESWKAIILECVAWHPLDKIYML